MSKILLLLTIAKIIAFSTAAQQKSVDFQQLFSTGKWIDLTYSFSEETL